MSNIDLILGDCIDIIKNIPNNTVDLIVTDPPYLMPNTRAGSKSELARSIQKMNDEIKQNNLTSGYDMQVLDEFVRVLKKINIYIWSNNKQIPMYFDFFVKKHKCAYDIIIWNKSNATPLYNNKYLTDKEYCLYFRKGGYCQPEDYQKAKTVYYQPINAKDKKLYNHPTIKPLNIITTLIENSSKEGDLILDPFMGSGTTGEACQNLNRDFIGIEIESKYYDIARKRLEKHDG